MINDLREAFSGNRHLIASAGDTHSLSPRRPHRDRSNQTLIIRLTRRLVALGSALIVMAGLGVAMAPAASAADFTTYLGDRPGGGGDLAAGGGKLFISASDRIIVTDSHGTVTGAITGFPSVSRVVTTPDGTRLYATLPGSNQLAEYDTADLTAIRQIDLSSYPCATNMSLSGTRLWVAYGCSDLNRGVFSLDMSQASPEPVPIETDGMLDPPLLVAAGNTLVIGDPGRSVPDLYVYDLSGATATLRGVISGQTNGLSRLRDLAITSDGSMVFPTLGGLYRFDGWDTTSLTRVRTYGEVPTHTRAVAISPDGAYFVGGVANTSGPEDIAVYAMDKTAEPLYTYANPAGELVAGSLAFSGTDIYGLLWDGYTSRWHLWRVHGGMLPASAMTLTAPSTGTAYKPVTLTGRLTLPGGSAPGAQTLVVTRRLPDGARTTLAGTTTGENGTFTFTDSPPVSGAVTYDVLWDGSADFRWSRASATVTVTKHQSSLTLSGPETGVAGKQLQFSGTLNTGAQATPAGTSLTIERTFTNRAGTFTAVLPAIAPVADGSFTFADTPPAGGQYTYTVRWDGDAASLPAQADQGVTVRGQLG
ncbi:hypothetical protein OHA25_03425 [Nonomuraea sp. NBC_00507]|uniref:hypothetical protein n=1 Tax=Nonomuraea sp. NBC_00507 TaxID=2976002 RepID=UPI002E1888E6